MGLTTAERNKRKRERKKKEREERLKREEEEKLARQEAEEQKPKDEEDDEQVEIEYVAEPLFSLTDDATTTAEPNSTNSTIKEGGNDATKDGEEKKEDIESVLRRFHLRASVSAVVTDDERGGNEDENNNKNREGDRDGHDDDEDDDDDESPKDISKRKQREMDRPSVAELKQRVARADLVEAHDVTAADPDFLIFLKSVPGTVPVPRHWGRKRKYLQGKRGIEKAPFALPDFLVKTGICEIRDSTAEDESKMSIKQRNRSRVAPRMGGTDVDYRTLYDAFFKHQTKPKSLTKFGDLYYEGKEFETRKSSDIHPGGVLSETLRDALGMTEGSPPPWLINMQRYGPPPSYPNLKIPGLNAPLPEGCSYGYHLNGWGKPPVDAFGRPLYGGDPFGRPTPEGGDAGVGNDGLVVFGGAGVAGGLVTSDGKALGKKVWGALPTAADDEEEESSEEEEEETSDEEMAESEAEEEEEEEEGEEEAAETEGETPSGAESVLPGGVDSVAPTSALNIRKQPGDETPAAPKSLYTVLDQTAADREKQAGAVFASNVAYVLPGSGSSALPDDGAQSILSKAPMDETGKRKRSKTDDDEDADELGKKFKF